MSEPASPGAESGDSHRRAARAFARRVDRAIPEVEALYLFGSTVRGEAKGLGSDVDFLAVVADDASQGRVTERLRDLAYDVMLEFGPVVEVHVLSESAFERRRDAEYPFVDAALSEGEAYV